jgi:hypothetical protein
MLRGLSRGDRKKWCGGDRGLLGHRTQNTLMTQPIARTTEKEKAAAYCCGLAPGGKAGVPTSSDSGDDGRRDDYSSGDCGDNGNGGGGNNMPKQASARPRRTAKLALRHSRSTIAAWFPPCYRLQGTKIARLHVLNTVTRGSDRG